jgi:hypothetical protein
LFIEEILDQKKRTVEKIETPEGRVRIVTFSGYESWKISLLLMFRHVFLRRGKYIPAFTDQAIYPSYFRGELEILSGWDIWYGYDWIASNEQTDVFLTRFYRRYVSAPFRPFLTLQ